MNHQVVIVIFSKIVFMNQPACVIPELLFSFAPFLVSSHLTNFRILFKWVDVNCAPFSQSGPEAGSLDGRTKKVSSFLFHPFLPLALSIQQTQFLQSSVNIHFRG